MPADPLQNGARCETGHRTSAPLPSQGHRAGLCSHVASLTKNPLLAAKAA
jgi:hypothetical protein